MGRVYDKWEMEFVNKGYYPIAYGVYKGKFPLNGLWFNDGLPSNLCPDDWRDYIYNMTDYCDVDEIIVEINGNRREEIILFAKTSEDNIEEVIRKCKEFNGAWEIPPIKVVRYASFNENVIVDKLDADPLKSYFDCSLFNALIRYPNGNNIAPSNNYEGDLVHFIRGANINIVDIKKMSNYHFFIRGDFVTKYVKGKKSHANYCLVTDTGNFTSTIVSDDDELVMRTVASCLRKFDGNNFERPNISNLFGESLDDGEYLAEVSCVEHFVRIANGTRLLHYSEEYETFEIFDLPRGWTMLKGISMKMLEKRKIFDENNFDEKDPNIKEVYGILDSREKMRGRV